MQMEEHEAKTPIFEAAMRVHESLDSGEIVTRALEFLTELVDTESWAVFIKTEHANRLELVRAINFNDLPVGPAVEIEEAPLPVARAVSEQRTIIAAPGEDNTDTGSNLDDLAAL